MSEQTKSGVKMIGAGVMGFIAVAGLGGLLFTHDSGRGSLLSRARAQAPLPVGKAPVASGLSIPRPALAREPLPSSPAPLAGSVADDAAAIAAPAAAAVASSPQDGEAAPGTELGVLGDSRFAGKGESSSSARAEAKRVVEAAAASREKEAPARERVPRVRPDAGGRASIASSVHYGVTSRRELMGQAAGPVYNFSGRQAPGGERLAELASQADAQMSVVEDNIERSELSPEQKAQLKRRLRRAAEGRAE